MAAHQRTAQIAATNSAMLRRVLREVARRRREEARRIGARIAELRDRHHLTQQVAADRIGVAYRTYQTWEAGDATPRWHNFQKIATVYGVSVDHILGNDEIAEDLRTRDGVLERLAAIEREVSRQGDLLESLVARADSIVTAPGEERPATVAGAGAQLLETVASKSSRAPSQSPIPPAARTRRRA